SCTIPASTEPRMTHGNASNMMPLNRTITLLTKVLSDSGSTAKVLGELARPYRSVTRAHRSGFAPGQCYCRSGANDLQVGKERRRSFVYGDVGAVRRARSHGPTSIDVKNDRALSRTTVPGTPISVGRRQ